VAQAGLWDVDGTGLQKIDDPTLARAFLDKVNDYNFRQALQCTLIVGVYAALPQEVTAPLAFWSAVFAMLYDLRGRIPKDP